MKKQFKKLPKLPLWFDSDMAVSLAIGVMIGIVIGLAI